ncbi:MAG TPA: 16S rRNA (guanine(966)-N(2))-methyltransferase RsmD [Solirubrobacteraceae bacterium]|jgi:16S rRNA (guanine966-N2)-methyltransferase|nr:16S rRNA (guanine(966)-N(2))-methyltransferase RsmD [Solirubrobacteraceae bacterium]
MRVIGGAFGGRRLKAPRGRLTRPTSDRVREALFALLGDVSGAVALDLFAGAGGLGIEALSRGAARAVFVERSRPALGALRGNLQSLGIGPDAAQVHGADALEYLRRARRRADTYDLVFIDPPYRRAGEMGAELWTLLPPLLQPQARIVVESDRRAPLALQAPLEDERAYGDTSIRIYRQP